MGYVCVCVCVCVCVRAYVCARVFAFACVWCVHMWGCEGCTYDVSKGTGATLYFYSAHQQCTLSQWLVQVFPQQTI